MKKYIRTIVVGGLVLIPSVLLAASDFSTIGKTLTSIVSDILNPLITVILAIALIVFLWGIVKYVTAGADEKKSVEGRNLMIYGIIALFVMVSVWGLVKILTSTFNLQNNAPDVPQFAK